MPRPLAHIALAAGFAIVAATALVRGMASAESEGRGAVRSEVRDGVVKVEADHASIAAIIDDLSRTLGFEVHGDVSSEDLKVTRSLDGRLDDVIAHLLQGTNYMLVTEAGAPKRLIILSAGSAAARPDPPQPHLTMSVEELRQKEGELVVLIARYEDMSEEAREHANPEFAKRFKRFAEKLAGEVEAIRARLPR